MPGDAHSPTGNSSASSAASKGDKGAKEKKPLPVHFVPDDITPEKVLKYIYDVHTDKWKSEETQVTLENHPFDEGSMRAAFFMVDRTQPPGKQKFVAKMSKDPKESKTTYFLDVEMQALSKLFADEFNKYKVPKRVNFLNCCVIKCQERHGGPLLHVEPWMEGGFQKYSNNYGYVSYDDRNTPQAFSHFTYCHSGGKLLICDIQGVGDNYTDPQIHSRDGNGFGKGNLGHKGMARFFKTHKCNSICKFLGLPLVNPKTNDRGTTPQIEEQIRRLSIGKDKDGKPIPKPENIQESDEPPSPRLNQPQGAPENPLDPKLLGLTANQLGFIQSKFDLHKKGHRVDGAGLVTLCADLGCKDPLPLQKATELVRRLDVMGDGGVDFRQFVWWWCGVEED